MFEFFKSLFQPTAPTSNVTWFTEDWNATNWDRSLQLDVDEMLDFLLKTGIHYSREDVPWDAYERFYQDSDGNFIGWSAAIHLDDVYITESGFIPASQHPTGNYARGVINTLVRRANIFMAPRAHAY